jgi:hypothetical protein
VLVIFVYPILSFFSSLFVLFTSFSVAATRHQFFLIRVKQNTCSNGSPMCSSVQLEMNERNKCCGVICITPGRINWWGGRMGTGGYQQPSSGMAPKQLLLFATTMTHEQNFIVFHSNKIWSFLYSRCNYFYFVPFINFLYVFSTDLIGLRFCFST